ncbi:MAG TPA: hypothetical protein DDY88_03740 [Actinobacteria bacterium]|nr:hypothetical protein [Actinomycetota bacterium]
MTGTPANTAVWSEFDIYVSTDMAVALPASAAAAMPVGWGTPVGFLEGDDAIEVGWERSDELKFDHNGNLIRKIRRNFAETIKFKVMEDNAKTRALVHPGSSAGQLVTPVVVPVKLCLEAHDGTKTYRRITDNYAEIDVDGGWSEGASNLTNIPLIATIFPTIATKVRWIEQKTPTLVSIALTPLTLGLTTGQTKQVVATGTFDDASTQVLTDVVTWASSDIAKATVRFGDVTWVAAGSANITCSYLGVSSTAPVVVTAS